MNPVLILTHNCLELTKKCVASIQAQDIPTFIFIFDNGSTDGTQEWIEKNKIAGVGLNVNKGVSYGWNKTLSVMFDGFNGDTNVFDDGSTAEHILVVNNDTIIPPWFYSSLLSYDVPFVTGVSVDSTDAIREPEPRKELAPCPDFSAWLIRREAWDKVGPFNEEMVNYASDNDWHVRAHRAGIQLWNAGVPFYHERSSTLRNASPKERRIIELQADADRKVFRELYGCLPWEPGYADLFK